MITLDDYFGEKLMNSEVTPEFIDNASMLLAEVNTLLAEAVGAVGYSHELVDPDTCCQISGAKGGSGDGGFRLAASTTGSQTSQHRKANAVDIYDPDNVLDKWLTDDILRRYDLYREHPDHTPGWVHLQRVPPRSGKRTFIP